MQNINPGRSGQNPNIPIRPLPYPEEAPDASLSRTADQLLQLFFNKYSIPNAHWDFWRTVIIVIKKDLPYPAGMSSETKTLYLKPEFANPGIVAHEFAHLSYSLLDPGQKGYFPQTYLEVIQKDEMLRALYFQKPYMQTAIVEAHAEIFRYLGPQMPEALKKYYPKLMV
jgi:hypothetical protein